MRSLNDDVHPMLMRAKQKKVRLIASDIDWTLRDPTNSEYDFQSVQKLCVQVLKKGINVLILTGRDASLKRDFVPGIISYMKRVDVSLPLYAGCANGISLYEITQSGIHTLYSYTLTYSQICEILHIIGNTQKYNRLTLSDFQNRGISVFQKFLSSSWNDIIPKNYVSKAKPFHGGLYIEPSKISFVLPKNKFKIRSLIDTIRNNLPHEYVLKSDQEFGHITRSATIGGKIVADKYIALEYILKKTRCRSIHAVVFGGALDDIDRRMLENCPYSFTNQQGYKPKKITKPPFKLIGKKSPVGLVHDAISYLIT